jgi:adenylosuccinate lyase
MREVWSDENKYRKWLDIEIAACEVHTKLGLIPKDALGEIKAKAAFDTKRIDEIEEEVQHDVIAFLTSVAENVGPSSKYIHYGMTSSDVVDTGLSLLMRDAIDLLIGQTEELIKGLRSRAQEFKDTVMIGRTHGIHAEPITFGLKLLLWSFEMERNLKRLQRARDVISYGKISGAVGTYANIEIEVERSVCEELGLKPAKVSSQVLQRDRHAEYISALAITASSLDKFASEIRHLQRTEVREVEEPFTSGQKGSSAMPHKRNPVICERICGLSRIVRSNAQAAYENVALWHERDISHSSVERVIVPDSTILLDYMLRKFVYVMKNLLVYPENMSRNLNATGGLFNSQRVLLALITKGMTREEAYKLVQKNAMTGWEEGVSFKELLLKDKEVSEHLSPEELDELFDINYYIRRIDEILKRTSD